MSVPFNKPFVTGKELEYIRQAFSNGQFAGDGPFTQKCQDWLEQTLHCRRALLTHSCTAALEMAAVLADIGPGDEVIMPSFTFVSTANAFVLRGAVPVFVDVRGDTLNIDESKIEAAITPRTKAIIPVHYAGVACEMDFIMMIAKKHNLLVIEDAALGFMSSYKGRKLGSMGHMAALSFHETKNIISGEGGALLINDSKFIQRAEIIREKGTNRNQFIRGQVDKYTWVDIGSSYLPSELIAAFLLAQLESAHDIIKKRLDIWRKYHEAFRELQFQRKLKTPFVPDHCCHNAHIYYLLVSNSDVRTFFLNHLRQQGIIAAFHYIPLHDSPSGKKFGRVVDNLEITNSISSCLVRLPLWLGIEDCLDHVIKSVIETVRRIV